MGARDRDAALQPHQLGQHFGAAHHRDALRPCCHHFRIIALDRGRHHKYIGAGDVFRCVADGDGDALVAQAADIGALGSIRALHGVAEIAQYLGNAAHADTADSDEVDGSDLARQPHGRFLASSSSAKAADAVFSRGLKVQISRAPYWMPRFPLA